MGMPYLVQTVEGGQPDHCISGRYELQAGTSGSESQCCGGAFGWHSGSGTSVRHVLLADASG